MNSVKYPQQLLTLCDVEVEKVTVENCLNASCHHSYQVEKALKVVTVDPVENVQSAVGAKGKQVVRGDGLCFTCFADHEQLGQNGNWFQVDGKCPQNLDADKMILTLL